MAKFAALDAQYLTDRRQHGDADFWRTVDAFSLYCGIQTLGRVLALSSLLDRVRGVPGHIVELGAWRGATTLLFAKWLHLFEPHSPKVVHAFDLWDEGFKAEQWTPQDNPAAASQYAGTYQGNLEIIYQMLALYHLQDNVVLHQGRIEQTWPAFLMAEPGFKVSLALLDVDLYAPTYAALTGMHDRLSLGSLLIFDEYGHVDWPGETRAADEFLATYPGCYTAETLPSVRQPTLVLRRSAA